MHVPAHVQKACLLNMRMCCSKAASRFRSVMLKGLEWAARTVSVVPQEVKR